MLLAEAKEIAELRRELSVSLREYNAAHGFTKIGAEGRMALLLPWERGSTEEKPFLGRAVGFPG